MTATPSLLGGFTPISDHNPIPAALSRKLAASAQVGKGQFVTVSPSTGYASLNDGTVPLQIAAGNGDVAELSDTSATAGAAAARMSERFFYGLSMGTSTDGFTDADFGVPFWIKNENTLGKLSNSGGSNRSLGGLVFGLAADGSPIAWSGPIAHLIGRATLVTQAKVGGWYQHPVDGSAGAATSETSMVRERLHGVVTAIYFDTYGTVAADASDGATINVYKADGAGGTHVLMGSYNTLTGQQGAIAAGVPASFSLSAVAGALNVLETDVFSYEVTKSASGKIVPVGTLRVVQKVI